MKSLAVSFLGLMILVLTGCGPSRGEVTGKVTYKNEAIKQGSVQLQAADGSLHAGEIKDGTYTVKGVPTGKALISISIVDDSTIELNKKLASGGREGKINPADIAALQKAKVIPDKYNDFNKSGLSVEVKSPKTEHNITMD
jgi:hypothetical protein